MPALRPTTTDVHFAARQLGDVGGAIAGGAQTIAAGAGGAAETVAPGAGGAAATVANAPNAAISAGTSVSTD